MFLKKLSNASNGSRHTIKISSVLVEKEKRKFFNLGYAKSAGRNNLGRIVVRGRIGHKSNFLKIDFKRRATTKLAIVINNVRNSNRNTLMSLIKYSSGGYSYILSAFGFINGFWTQSIWRPERFSYKYVAGCVVFLKHIPIRSIFFNLEIFEGVGATIARAAGTSCLLLDTNHNTNISLVRIPTGKHMRVSSYCAVVLGKNHHKLSYKVVIGKCGNNIKKGFKSKVRGVAMNPVDHPHGGRTKTNSPEKSLWGKIAKLNK